MPYLIGDFSQKSPIISGSFAKNKLQLKASYASTPPFVVYIRIIQQRGIFFLSSPKHASIFDYSAEKK